MQTVAHDVSPSGDHASSHTQLAQAGAPGGAEPIGRVDTLAGTVTAQHVDGTTETLSQGASVYQRDLIATQAGAKVALVFADKTTFALGESGQMRLDEMVYDPSSKGGKMAVSMLKGAFAFVSGDIAGHEADAMTVRTPVGTIGIRGTAVTGNVDPGGKSTFSAIPDPSGATSTVVFTNGAGTQTLTENFSITVETFFTSPSVPFATPGGAPGEAATLAFIASAIASTINPGGSHTDDTGPGHAPTSTTPTGTAPDTAHDPTIHFSVGDATLPNGLETFSFTIHFEIIPPIPIGTPLPIPTFLLTPPSPPPSDETITQPPGFVGTLGIDTFHGNPAPAINLFDFVHIHNSLQSGDTAIGNGLATEKLIALFDKPFAIDSTLTITNVATIDVTLGGGASTLDATGITTTTGAAPSTLFLFGNGTLDIANLQVNLNASAMPGALDATVTGSGVTVEGSQGGDLLIGAGYGHGDVLSYADFTTAINLSFLTGLVQHGGVTDTISGFDGVIGTAQSDLINVSLAGPDPSFTVEGGAGNNTLIGSLSDNDFLSYVHAPASITADFADGSGTVANGYGGTDIFSGFSGIIANFSTINVTGAADHLTVDGFVNTITAGDGNDTLMFNPGVSNATVGFDTISVGNGDDSISLSSVVYSVTAGNGDDTITGSASFDTISAGSGSHDLISLTGGVVSIATADNAGAADTISVGLGFDTISVGNGNDVISATGGAVSIAAGNGNDQIYAGGGFETISVGSGNDLISVTNGNGTPFNVTAGGGDDTVTVDGVGGVASIGFGSTGDDSIVLTGSFDTLNFGSGHDIINVTGGDDFLNDGAMLTRDFVTIAGNFDTLVLTSGNNAITVSGLNDSIAASGGNDTITFGAGGSSITIDASGSQFDDDVVSMTGDDTVSALVASDDGITINGAGSNNVVFVNGTDDFIAVNNTGIALTINGDDSVALAGSDTLSVVGSTPFAAVLGGDDLVVALGSGNASIDDGFGHDTITLGGGDDTIVLGASLASGGFNHVAVGGGDDAIIDNFGDDTIVAGNGSDTIALGDDCSNAPGGFNLIVLGGGSDTVTDVFGDDTITAGNGNDSIALGTGFEFGGANLIIVGVGNDTINDNFGDDIVVIGAGATHPGDDALSFGCGGAALYAGFSDSFTATLSDGTGTISDSDAVHAINISGAGISGLFGNGADDTLILNGFGDSLNIAGIAEVSVAGGNGDQVYLTLIPPGVAGVPNDNVPVLGAHSLFDFSNADDANLTFDIGGTQTITITGVVGGGGLTADQFDLAPASTGGAPVTDLVLENGNYNLTFDGSFGDPVHVQPAGTGTDTLIDNTGSVVLDFTQVQGPIILTIESFAQNFGCGGAASVTGAGDNVQFSHFTSLIGNAGQTSELIFPASIDSAGINTIDLVNGQITGDNGFGPHSTSISQFNAVDYQGDDNISFFVGANDVVTTGGGNDTVQITNGGDTVTFGNGNDYAFDTPAGGGSDAINAGTGSDTFSLYNGHNSIAASGSDVINTYGGDDTILTSGVGTENIAASGSNDSIQGNGGTDFISISGGGSDAIGLGSGTNFVTLNDSTVGGDTVSGFNGDDHITLESPGDVINTGGANMTVTGFQGGSQIYVTTGAGELTLALPTALGSFSNDTTSGGADANTDVINNFQDSAGSHTSVIDLSGLSNVGTETFAGSLGTFAAGTPFSTAFAAAAANQVEYAVIGGNTFVHANSSTAGGYSAGDLLVELTGQHTLTGANVHLHP